MGICEKRHESNKMSSSGWLSLWSSASTCNGVRRNGGGGSSNGTVAAAAAAVFGLQGVGQHLTLGVVLSS